MAKFIISQRANGQYYFNLRSDNGAVILSSEGYTSKIGCLNGIESVKINGSIDLRYDRKTSSKGKHYFNLKALNGQIIGTSEMYESKEGLENGIESAKKSIIKSSFVDAS